MIPVALMSALSFVRANWKALAGAVVGAALCAPLAYCEGKSAGKLASAKANLESSLKVQQAALKVERAANLADMARRAKTAEQITELREIVTHEGTNDTVGGATGALLDRLRRNAR